MLGATLAATLAAPIAAAAVATSASVAQRDAEETAVDSTGVDATATNETSAVETLTGDAPADATAVDALRCWRRVDRNAVFVGERFTMTVTCRTVETEAARTQLDEAALEPATIDASPFEVLSGERFDDVLTGPYRFSQHDYTLRLVAETGFGEDVEIPALDLPYRIERRVGDGPALAGRELTYILPAESVRLLSLVPDAVDDIRDLPAAGFAAAQAGELRANVLGLLSAFFGVAALGRRSPLGGALRRALGKGSRGGPSPPPPPRAAAPRGWSVRGARRHAGTATRRARPGPAHSRAHGAGRPHPSPMAATAAGKAAAGATRMLGRRPPLVRASPRRTARAGRKRTGPLAGREHCGRAELPAGRRSSGTRVAPLPSGSVSPGRGQRPTSIGR